jgi:hypothetical protein
MQQGMLLFNSLENLEERSKVTHRERLCSNELALMGAVKQ